MVSSVTAEGAPATVDALLNGAIDCILKPAGVDAQAEVQSIAKALKEHVKAILQNRSVSPASGFVSAKKRLQETSVFCNKNAGCYRDWSIDGWSEGVADGVTISSGNIRCAIVHRAAHAVCFYSIVGQSVE